MTRRFEIAGTKWPVDDGVERACESCGTTASAESPVWRSSCNRCGVLAVFCVPCGRAGAAFEHTVAHVAVHGGRPEDVDIIPQGQA